MNHVINLKYEIQRKAEMSSMVHLEKQPRGSYYIDPSQDTLGCSVADNSYRQRGSGDAMTMSEISVLGRGGINTVAKFHQGSKLFQTSTITNESP